MPRKPPSLTKSQVGRIRANLARQASNIGARVSKNALGLLTDNEGNPIEMTPSQIRSSGLILKHVLPAMAMTEYADVTEKPMTRGELIKQANEIKQQIIDNLTPEEVAEKLKAIPAVSADVSEPEQD